MIIAMLIVTVAIALAILLGIAVTRLVLYPALPPDLGGAENLDASAHRVRIPLPDGDGLDGWHLAGSGCGAILLLHGFGRTHHRMWRYGDFLNRAGYDLLAVDFRSSQRQGRKPTTLGHHELPDAQAALEWLRALPSLAGQPLGVLGESLGGSVGLLLAAPAGALRGAGSRVSRASDERSGPRAAGRTARERRGSAARPVVAPAPGPAGLGIPMAAVPSARIRLGTQGWSYPDWVGSFYPPGAKQEDYLEFYARVFDTVELDTPFYHPPKPTIARSWERHTPPGFTFAAKVPQRITHEARLSKMGEHLAEFAKALEPLGEKLGPLLVQLPAEFTRDQGTVGLLDRFLAAAPSAVRLPVQFRDPPLHPREIYELLRRPRAARARAAGRGLPPITGGTPDFPSPRWAR